MRGAFTVCFISSAKTSGLTIRVTLNGLNVPPTPPPPPHRLPPPMKSDAPVSCRERGETDFCFKITCGFMISFKSTGGSPGSHLRWPSMDLRCGLPTTAAPPPSSPRCRRRQETPAAAVRAESSSDCLTYTIHKSSYSLKNSYIFVTWTEPACNP